MLLVLSAPNMQGWDRGGHQLNTPPGEGGLRDCGRHSSRGPPEPRPLWPFHVPRRSLLSHCSWPPLRGQRRTRSSWRHSSIFSAGFLTRGLTAAFSLKWPWRQSVQVFGRTLLKHACLLFDSRQVQVALGTPTAISSTFRVGPLTP